MNPPVALTIAGSDSGGGAGIQADLKTFTACGVYAASAVTALTAQNTRGVLGVLDVPADFLRAQVDAVLDDLTVKATKTGMLATAEIVATVAEMAERGRLPHLVVDPVMVSSSGARLLEHHAEDLYRDALLPHAAVVTPNLHEAAVLLGEEITTLAAQHEAARALGRLCPGIVVVKGGHPTHGTEQVAIDVVWDGRTTTELSAPRVDTVNSHGTGCTFSAAIAAALAYGAPHSEAVQRAKAFVTRAINDAADWRLGGGHGPLNHFGHGKLHTGSLGSWSLRGGDQIVP